MELAAESRGTASGSTFRGGGGGGGMAGADRTATLFGLGHMAFCSCGRLAAVSAPKPPSGST
jgi:hypothetical protein